MAEKIDFQKWHPRKKHAQDEMSKLELGITFYNVFNKRNNRLRKDPHRYLICLAKSKEERTVAVEKAREIGFSCTFGKEYLNPDTDPTNQSGIYASYSFKIDLESVEV